MKILNAYDFDEKMNFDDMEEGFATLQIAFPNLLNSRNSNDLEKFLKLFLESLLSKNFTKIKFKKTLMNFIANHKYDKFSIAEFLQYEAKLQISEKPEEAFPYCFRYANEENKYYYFSEKEIEKSLPFVIQIQAKVEAFDLEKSGNFQKEIDPSAFDIIKLKNENNELKAELERAKSYIIQINKDWNYGISDGLKETNKRIQMKKNK